MEESVCPVHGVPTLMSSVFQPSDERVTIGSILGERYRIEKELGSGSIGSVFVATQSGLGRRVAVKILKDIMKPGTHVRRFYQEAQAVSLLSHPSLVGVLDFGVDLRTHFPYLVMELVEGRTLRKVLDAEERMPERRALSLVTQVARGLAEAHAKNVVHRDLKPENIMVATLADGRELVKILDFGMATVLTSDGERAQRITATGTTVGTPLYMSPEQVRSSLVDFRSDLYSLGCILFELLAGNPPFVSDRVVEVMTMHLKNPPPSLPSLLADGKAPTPELTDLLKWLLEKQRDKRPKTTTEVADILDRLANASETERRSLPIPEASTEIATPSGPHARPPVDSAAVLDSEKPTILKPQDYDAKDAPDDATGPQPVVSIGTSSPPAVPDPAGATLPNPTQEPPRDLFPDPAPEEGSTSKSRSLAWILGGVAILAVGIALSAPKSDVEQLPSRPTAPTVSKPISDDELLATATQIRGLWPGLGSEIDRRLEAVKNASTTEAKERAVRAVRELARIRVDSDPTGARVYDGLTELGQCPLEIPRPTGTRVLRLVAEGRTGASLNVDENTPSPVVVTLQ
ncbi:MAG: protein kinase [Deltaproteobacteria bacterium]|nr:protein kinase [Deltaproteobacteria bacterium]